MFLKKIRTLLCVVIAFTTLSVQAQNFDHDFFGMHVHRSVANSLWKEVGFAGIRLHDSNVTWSDLEPLRGVWHWDKLDGIVENATAHHNEILLPLNGTPTWASSSPFNSDAYGLGSASPPVLMSDWNDYVIQVVSRYKGKVKAYEIWNEPNLKQFYTGTPGELFEITRNSYINIKKNDPDAIVVCSAITGSYGLVWFKKYLDTGVGRYCDVMGYHFYTSHKSPEAMLPIISAVKSAMRERGLENKPLWNTETGWLIENGSKVDAKAAGFGPDAKVLTAYEAGSYVPRALLIARSAGVDRFYWYSWDHKSMGLSSGMGIGWSRAARVYSTFTKLVSGSRISNCSNAGQIWTCHLILTTGKKMMVYWSDNANISVKSPFDGSLFVFSDFGNLVDKGIINSGDVVEVTGDPVYIKE